MPGIRVGDIELNYSEHGAGRPVLLVHGFPLDHTMWRPQLENLSDRCRLIAPDLRGFGKSTGSAGAGTSGSGTVTMERFSDDLAGLLDALKITEPVIFCGLSMGGYIAWQFWKKHAARLAGLILCDTRAAADSAETARGRLVAAEQVERQGPSAVVEPMLGKLFAKTTAEEQPDLVKRTHQQMLSVSPVAIAAALRGMAARPDMTSELPRISIPTLVLCGEYDVISPVSEMRGMAEKLPNAKFVEISHAGHLTALERPGQVNDAIRQFLADLP